jgi:hypothetical protein
MLFWKRRDGPVGQRDEDEGKTIVSVRAVNLWVWFSTDSTACIAMQNAPFEPVTMEFPLTFMCPLVGSIELRLFSARHPTGARSCNMATCRAISRSTHRTRELSVRDAFLIRL